MLRLAHAALPAAQRRLRPRAARALSSNGSTNNDDKPPPPEGTVAPKKHYWQDSPEKWWQVIPKDEREKGYFFEYKEVSRYELGPGKPYASSGPAAAPNAAPVFPHLPDTATLDGADVGDLPTYLGGGHTTTLVAVAFRDFGFKHLESWIAPFVARCGYQPRLRVVQLSVVDRWIYKLFRSSFVSAMRRDIDVSRHHASLLHFGHAMELREPLQIPNKLCAYVYLVDGRGRIRWRASGEATPAEVDEMLEVTEHLIDEAKGEEAGGGGGGRGRGKRGRR